MATPTFFVDDAAVTARTVEVPNADWDGGGNNGASCSQGLGINYLGGAVVGTPEQFTLLDQRGDPRTTQISQLIGGSGLGSGTSGTAPDATIRAGTPSANGDGSVTPIANVSLVSLAAGWVAQA
jgi:hypothetical protein